MLTREEIFRMLETADFQEIKIHSRTASTELSIPSSPMISRTLAGLSALPTLRISSSTNASATLADMKRYSGMTHSANWPSNSTR